MPDFPALNGSKNRCSLTSQWLDGLERRMHFNKVVVALANKIARIAWAILVKPGMTYQRIDPMYTA